MKGRQHLEEVSVDERLILKRNTEDTRNWVGFVWKRMRIRGGLW
jgi:hypothetical protein